MDDSLLPQASSLSASLSQLASTLQPLLEKPLKETLASLNGDMDRAKLQVVLGLLIEETLWVYMKAKGIKTTDVGVDEERERIKKYFSKINKISGGLPDDPRKTTVDTAAAARFIKSALSGNKPFPESANAGSSSIDKSSRFNIVSAQESLSGRDFVGSTKGKEREVDGDDVLMQDSEGESEDIEAVAQQLSKVSSASVTGSPAPAGAVSRMKRPRIDPFSGYDSAASSSTSSTTPPLTAEAKSQKKKAKKERRKARGVAAAKAV